MAARKVVLGAELGTKLPPRKDPRVDSPEPFPAAIPSIPGPAPMPNFRRSRMPHVDRNTAKWIGITTIVTGLIGAITMSLDKLIPHFTRADPKIVEMQKSNELLAQRINAVASRQTQHLLSCKAYQRANASAWREHPNGEVKFRDVDANIRLDSRAANPPVSEVDMAIPKLPEPLK
jgi:hypothetical protein